MCAQIPLDKNSIKPELPVPISSSTVLYLIGTEIMHFRVGLTTRNPSSKYKGEEKANFLYNF